MARHVTYIDAALKAATGEWGQKAASSRELEHDLLKDIRIDGACAMFWLQTFDTVVDALTTEQVKRHVHRLWQEKHKQIDMFIAEREPKHGPCPKEVQDALERSIDQNVGRCFLSVGRLDYLYIRIDLPEPGTAARKAYDAWMRKQVNASGNTPRGKGKHHVSE